MLEPKKTLIKMYNEGRLNDKAVYNLSAFNGLTIIEIDEDTVFGYHQYMSDEKQFFRVKLRQHEEYEYFIIQNSTFRLDEFMRIF